MNCVKNSFANEVVPLPQQPVLLSVSSLNLKRYETGSIFLEVIPTDRKLTFQFIRMLMTMAVPVIAVIVFTAVIFGNAKRTYDDSWLAKDKTGVTLAVGELVESLQRERGMSAMFVSSNGENRDAFQRLLTLRQETDSRARAINKWLPTFAVGNTSLPSLNDFMIFIGGIRNHIDLILLTPTQSIEFFSKLNDNLIKWFMKSVDVPNIGRMKNLIAASDAFLIATEHFGKQRALATGFFTRCYFQAQDRTWFTMLEGSSQILLQLAFNMDSMSKVDYRRNKAAISDSMKSYMDFKSCIWNMTCNDVCLNSTVNDRYETSSHWYENITVYINMVHTTRRFVVDRINDELDSAISSSRFDMILYMSLMLVVSLGCLILTIANGVSIRDMTKRVTHFTAQLAKKTKALSKERERADRLLYTMLPSQIADRLKHNVAIEAEFYDSVSIYFSDIVGFTQFSSRVSPLMVITMLNSLYNLFDDCIDRYDVYKVETIGDAYMVASGLPERNEMRHVAEIARMSIEIVNSVNVFSIPQLPGEIIKIRVGIHTGEGHAWQAWWARKCPDIACSGIPLILRRVWKAPEKKAISRTAQKIHVSDVTSSLLIALGEFHLERRGSINVKGKGTMETCWLISQEENTLHTISSDIDFPTILT